MFAIVAISIWAVGHLYLGWSLGRFVGTKKWRRALWAALLVHFIVTIVGMSVGRMMEDTLFRRVLQWIAYVGMGGFALLFMATLARDIIYGLAKIGHFIATIGARRRSAAASRVSLEESTEQGAHILSRRELFHSTLNLGLVGLAATGTTYGYFQATRVPPVLRIDVPIKDLAEGLDGFQIVQLSDIHIGPTIRGAFFEAVVDRVNALNADMVAVTGDMVDGFIHQLRPELVAGRRLKSRFGTYYCTGNHEYYWDGPGWSDEFASYGWHVLNNAHEVIDVDGAKLLIGGVTDYSAGRTAQGHTSDPHQAIADAPPTDFRLLLAHQPKSVWEAERAGFDLQLSGHTHGGQFWPWSLLVGLAHPFSRGLHDYEKMKIYVSCGTGYWGPPLRIAAPSEITLLTLKKV